MLYNVINLPRFSLFTSVTADVLTYPTWQTAGCGCSDQAAVMGGRTKPPPPPPSSQAEHLWTQLSLHPHSRPPRTRPSTHGRNLRPPLSWSWGSRWECSVCPSPELWRHTPAPLRLLNTRLTFPHTCRRTLNQSHSVRDDTRAWTFTLNPCLYAVHVCSYPY